jgi:hypothetical protein
LVVPVLVEAALVVPAAPVSRLVRLVAAEAAGEAAAVVVRASRCLFRSQSSLARRLS